MLKKIGILLGLSLAMITSNVYADSSDNLLNDIGILDDNTTQQSTGGDTSQQNASESNTNTTTQNVSESNTNTTTQNASESNTNTTTQSLPTLNYINNGDDKKIEIKIDKNNSNFVITFLTGESNYIINDIQLFAGLTGENITDSLSDIMKNISIVKVDSNSNDVNKYYFSEFNSDNGILVKPTDKIYIIGELKQSDVGAILKIIGKKNLVIKMRLNNPNYLGKLINQNSFEIENLYKYEELQNTVVETVPAKNEKKVKKQVTGSSDYLYGALFLLSLLIIGFYYNNKEGNI